MAEVMMSKTCFVSPSSSIPHQHHYGVSVFPTKSAIFSSGIGFLSLKHRSLPLRSPSSSFIGNIQGSTFLLQGLEGTRKKGNTTSSSLNAKMSIGIIGKAKKWWEKELHPNMKEVKGAQDLVDSLLIAGDKLVVVDFFSPGCGGCRALHPKICQLAEMNPDVQFLQVNYEEHKSMCYTLNVHVLPFFRFYRGAHGRLCSFSCTNATIKKFKDALAKHSPDRCSLGSPKGLEEKELLALAANKDLSYNYAPKQEQPVPVPAREEHLAEMAPVPVPACHSEAEPALIRHSTTNSNAVQDTEVKTLVTSGR